MLGAQVISLVCHVLAQKVWYLSLGQIFFIS